MRTHTLLYIYTCIYICECCSRDRVKYSNSSYLTSPHLASSYLVSSRLISFHIK